MASKRVDWSEVEWFDLMRLIVPERDRTGAGLGNLMIRLQKKCLPKSRWRGDSLATSGLPLARDYEARYRSGWVPTGRKTEPDKPEAVRNPDGTQKARDRALEASFTDARKGATSQIYWTQREWAMVACRVKHRIEVMGDTRGLPRVFFEGQAEVLPLERCRKMGGFAALPPLQAAYDAAIPNIWTLPAEVRAKCEGRGADWDAQQAKAREGLASMQATQAAIDAAPPAPPAPPVPVEGMPQTAPPAPVVAPLPGDPLAARLALIVADACGRVAAETRAYVMAEYDKQLDRLTVALASTLREYVHTLVSSELGPIQTPPPVAGAAPSAPPVDTNGAPPADTPPTAPEAAAAPEPAPLPRMKVDIVGAERIGTAQVRSAADRLGIDVRLIDADQLARWEPRPNVILATQFVPHKANRVAKAAGANLLFATGGPASVVGIMESLAEHRGALQ